MLSQCGGSHSLANLMAVFKWRTAKIVLALVKTSDMLPLFTRTVQRNVGEKIIDVSTFNS